MRSQLLRHELEDGRGLSDLDVIEGEAQRCRRIVDSLLEFSRRSEGVMARIDVNSLIKRSLSLVENDLKLKGISVEDKYSDNGVIVRADSNQIQQVLLNLVTNAADAMPDGGHLQIETRLLPDQNAVELRVTDDGHGMDHHVLSRAFDPFFTTKEKGKGTGLGLAICRRIIEEHEGKIGIQSQAGKGTIVYVRLPRVPLEESAGG